MMFLARLRFSLGDRLSDVGVDSAVGYWSLVLLLCLTALS